MMSMVPFAGSVPAMVRGILSPVSVALSTTNCPGRAFLAIRGASILKWQTVLPAISLFSTILNKVLPPSAWYLLGVNYHKIPPAVKEALGE
jgi:hypothetical protein